MQNYAKLQIFGRNMNMALYFLVYTKLMFNVILIIFPIQDNMKYFYPLKLNNSLLKIMRDFRNRFQKLSHFVGYFVAFSVMLKLACTKILMIHQQFAHWKLIIAGIHIQIKSSSVPRSTNHEIYSIITSPEEK